MPTPSIQTLRADAQQVLNLDSISAVRSVVAATLANANAGTPLNPNLTTQQLWNEFYQIVTQPKSDIESIIANQLMKFLYAPPAPGGAGADKQVIFNDGGVLAGDPQFLWNKTTNLLTVTGAATITGDLTVDTNTFFVDSANNRVGIGTASPATILDIRSAGSVFARIQNTASSADAYLLVKNGAGEGFFGINATGPYIYTAQSIPITFTTATSERYRIASDGVATWQNVGGVAGTAMTLNSTGLGVGASPTEKLTINNSPGAVTGGIRVYANDQSIARIAVQNTNGQAWHLVAGNPGANNQGFAIYDYTNSATRMYFDTSGNVGIGVTPSAWGSVYRGIQMRESYAAIFSDNGNGVCEITSNAYNDGVWKYANAVKAARYQIDAANGQHEWYTAGTGSVGGTITFTERLRLKETGQLRFIPLAADPSGAEAGDIYYNSSSNKLKCYDGSTWNDLF